jgi:hypothetical protein
MRYSITLSSLVNNCPPRQPIAYLDRFLSEDLE